MKTDVYEEEASTATVVREAGTNLVLLETTSRPGRDDEKGGGGRHAGARAPGARALEGDWKAEVKCWMEPGGSPEVSQATANAKWTLNGRFMEEEFHGEMMGKPFNGLLLLGYDNTKQTYNSVWLSDNQTSMFVSEGKGASGNKVITLEGKANCPATGQKDIPMKTVLRLIGPDKHVLEMFDGSKGANAKTMEITYTRQ